MKTKTLSSMIVSLAMFVAAAPLPVRASSAALDAPNALSNNVADQRAEKARLQARFEARYPDVARSKSDGKIGETSAGYLDAVGSADGTLKKLIDEENADRRSLYKLIADDEGISPDAVAQRAAARNFKKAKKGEFVKDGPTWKQKK